jgi:hypothetical protein
MEERYVPVAQETRPVEDGTKPPGDAGTEAGEGGATGIRDPRALQILSTEHWSLLTARSLVYNEAFARGGMFMAFLSATLLVLGLISTATGFSDAFLTVAALILGLDLFVGLATLGRINGAGSEDLLYLQGMNRLRNAYHEIVPGLEDYFITSKYDDFDSVVGFYGPGTEAVSNIGGLLHGLTTMPLLISVICCALGSMLSAIVTLLLTHEPGVAAIVASLVFLVLFAIFAWWGYSAAMGFAEKMPAKFPRPRAPGEPPLAPGMPQPKRRAESPAVEPPAPE